MIFNASGCGKCRVVLPRKEEPRDWFFYLQNDIHAPENGRSFYAKSYVDFDTLLKDYAALPDDRERGIYAKCGDEKVLLIRRVIQPECEEIEVVDFTPIYYRWQDDHPLFEPEIRKAVKALHIQYGCDMMQFLPIQQAIDEWREACMLYKKAEDARAEKLRLPFSEGSDGQPGEGC